MADEERPEEEPSEAEVAAFHNALRTRYTDVYPGLRDLFLPFYSKGVPSMPEGSEPRKDHEWKLKEANSLISSECDSLKALLLRKNEAYGNSALDPMRIFSSSDSVEQIKVRIDDKLNRIKKGRQEIIQEDAEQDLLGYLILLRVARRLQAIQDCIPTIDLVDSAVKVTGRPAIEQRIFTERRRAIPVALEGLERRRSQRRQSV